MLPLDLLKLVDLTGGGEGGERERGRGTEYGHTYNLSLTLFFSLTHSPLFLSLSHTLSYSFSLSPSLSLSLSLWQVPQGATDVAPDILSYYHPNLTINLVDDHTHWTPGAIPQPMDKCKRKSLATVEIGVEPLYKDTPELRTPP